MAVAVSDEQAEQHEREAEYQSWHDAGHE